MTHTQHHGFCREELIIYRTHGYGLPPPSPSSENTHSYKVHPTGAEKADVTTVECLAPWRAHQLAAAACVRFYEKQKPNYTSDFKHRPQIDRSPYPTA